MIIRFTMLLLLLLASSGIASDNPASLRENNEDLLSKLQEVHRLSDAQVDSLRAIFLRSGYIGQGNPRITEHPASEEDCHSKLEEMDITYENPLFLKICGHRYMAPLYDPENQPPESAKVCIDQFEFPNIPCSYPVVWVRAEEAVRICEILGKRLCDAHEWEGACEGSLKPPDYRFDLAVGRSVEAAIRLMREAHNRAYGTDKSWSYGSEYRSGIIGVPS